MTILRLPPDVLPVHRAIICKALPCAELELPRYAFLLAQRSAGCRTEQNVHECPGGAAQLEDQCKPLLTVRREVFEETGLQVTSILQQVFQHEVPYESLDANDIRTRRNIRYHLVHVASTEGVLLSPEHQGFCWVTFPELLLKMKMTDVRRGCVRAIAITSTSVIPKLYQSGHPLFRNAP